MVDIMYRFVEDRIDEWQEGRFFASIWKSLLFLAVTILTVIVLFYIICAIINFVSYYFEFLVIIGSSTGLILYFIKEHYREKKKQRLEQQEKEQQQQSKADEYLIARNYDLLREILYQTLQPVCDVLKLKKPQDIKELDSPNTCIRRGNILLYQYVVIKNAMSLDVSIIKKALQEVINRNLSANAYSGLGQTAYLYEAKNYPIIMIDSVEETSAYIIINMVIVDRNYCEYLTRNASSSLLQQAHQLSNIVDKDL